MKVLLAHNFYRSSAPSGEDAVYNNEKALLESHGVEVIPFELMNDDIYESGVVNKLILAKNTIWSNKTYTRLNKVIESTTPDIAHFHNTFPQISPGAYAACKRHGVPVIQTIHNYRLICPGGLLQRNGIPCEDCVGTTLLPALLHRCYRTSIAATGTLVAMLYVNRLLGTYVKNVDHYIALTDFSASRLIAGGIPANKIIIKPNFLPNPPAPGARNLGHAVYVGRLSEEKGLRTLINSWTPESIPLKVLGDGPLRCELEKSASSRNLPIEFLGYQDRDSILSTVSGAIVQIVPSEWYEGFPMVILEAFACGTPVIASRIGSLAEIIQPGTTGEVFTAGNPAELAYNVDKIATMAINEPGKYEKLRAKVRRHFDDHFTPENNIKLLLKIYENTLISHRHSQQ